MRLYLNRMLSALIDRFISESVDGLRVSVSDRRLICDAVTHALYGLLEQWLTGPDAPLMQSNLHRIVHSFEGGIRLALQYCAKTPREEAL